MAAAKSVEPLNASANLNTLPVEILTLILEEVIAEDVAQRSDRMLDETRLNVNARSLLPLLQTSRRFFLLARDTLYARVRLSEIARIRKFATTVVIAPANKRGVLVRDLGIDYSIYGRTKRMSKPTTERLPPFLHMLSTLRCLTLSSLSGQDALVDSLEELPLALNLFPCLEQFRVTCQTTLTPRSLVPFWAAPQLKLLYLKDIEVGPTGRNNELQDLEDVASLVSTDLKPLEKLELRYVSLELSEQALAVLANLRAVHNLSTQNIRVRSSRQRSCWHGLIVVLAPGIKHLASVGQDFGQFLPHHDQSSQVFASYLIPPLGMLVQAKSLEITEQQLENALGMRGSNFKPQDCLPSSINRLCLSIASGRIGRMRLYEVLARLLVAYRAGQLPNLTHIKLHFQRNSAMKDLSDYQYSHNYIDLEEIEERGLTESQGYEFPGGRTLEQKAFEQECRMCGLDVISFDDSPPGT